jgi:hypothetical protein
LVPTKHHEDHSGTQYHPNGSTENAPNPLLTIHIDPSTSIPNPTPENIPTK